MASSTMPAVHLRQVTRQFPRGLSIGPVTFDVPPASVTGLVGPNGAGKTTILRMVCGLLGPSSGRVEVHGEPVRPGRPPERLGAVIEAPAFYPWASGRQNLLLVAAGRRDWEARIESTLALVGLDEMAVDRKVATYSQGMRQRLALGRSLLGQPSLLILDEPTNGLDPEGIAWLRGLLREFARDGVTVLVSSHLLGEVQLLADQVVAVGRDHQARMIPIAELDSRADALERVYFGGAAVAEQP